MNKIKVISVVVFFSSLTVATAHPGVGIVMDSKGNVFYTDLRHIWKIDNKGTRTIAVQNVHSHEIYLDENDNLYGEHLWYEGEATDKWGHYVWKYSPSGTIEKVIPPSEGFLTNYSFVRDDHDHMFWADRNGTCQQITRKNPDQTSTHLGKHCFSDIRWMTATPEGNVYLIDAYDLKKVEPNGNVKIMAENIPERKLTQFTVNDSHLAMGLWTDKKENVYVAIYGARKVKKITPDKKVSVVVETSMMWSPTGGLVAPNGDFWLLEYSQTNQARVERITVDGERIVYSGAE